MEFLCSCFQKFSWYVSKFPHQCANSLNAVYLNQRNNYNCITTWQPPVLNLKHTQQHISWSKTKDQCIHCFFFAHTKINCTQKNGSKPDHCISPTTLPLVFFLFSFSHSYPSQSSFFSPSVIPTPPSLLSFLLQSFLPLPVFFLFSFSRSYPSHLLSFLLQSFLPIPSSFFSPSVVPTHPIFFLFPLGRSYPSHLLSFPPRSFLPIPSSFFSPSVVPTHPIFFLFPLGRSYPSHLLSFLLQSFPPIPSSFFSPSVVPTHPIFFLFSFSRSYPSHLLSFLLQSFLPFCTEAHPVFFLPSVFPTLWNVILNPHLSELSCVKEEVDVLGSPSLTIRGRNQRRTWTETLQSPAALWKKRWLSSVDKAIAELPSFFPLQSLLPFGL